MHSPQVVSEEISMANVARSLEMADQELQAAIDSFNRARRMTFFDFLRPGRVEQGSEEVHVRHGLEAILSAERHVTSAAEAIEVIQGGRPGVEQLGSKVRSLDGCFRTMLHDLRTRPNPRRLVSQLKQVRKAIPHDVVRRYDT